MSQNGHTQLLTPPPGSTTMIVGTGDLPSGHWFDTHEHPQHQIAWAARGVITVQIGAGRWVLPPTRALWIPGGVAHRTGTSHGATMRGIFVEPEHAPIAFSAPTLLRVSRLLHELFDHLVADARHTADDDTTTSHDDQTVTQRDNAPTRQDDTATRHDSTATRHDNTATRHDNTATRRDSTATRHDSTATRHDNTPTQDRSTIGQHDAMTTLPDDGPRRRAEAVVFDLLDPVAVVPVGAPMPTDPRALIVAGSLVRDPADDRSLHQFAALSAASPRTLARLFLAETGMTFGQWRTQIRLAASLPLLAGGLPVTRVAERIGYGTSSAYVAAFRRTVGISPGRYFAR